MWGEDMSECKRNEIIYEESWREASPTVVEETPLDEAPARAERPREENEKSRPLLITIQLVLSLLAALVFMYAPILILALYSFTDATQIGAIRGFTMKNYVTLFTTEELRNMIIGTVLLALAAAFIAMIPGVALRPWRG